MHNVEAMTDSQKLDYILSEITNIKTTVKAMEMDIENINLALEKEIRANILQIAKRNNFLWNELNRVIERMSEIVLLSVKVTTLENKVREFKEKGSE